jgi:hypothetical protein
MNDWWNTKKEGKLFIFSSSSSSSSLWSAKLDLVLSSNDLTDVGVERLTIFTKDKWPRVQCEDRVNLQFLLWIIIGQIYHRHTDHKLTWVALQIRTQLVPLQRVRLPCESSKHAYESLSLVTELNAIEFNSIVLYDPIQALPGRAVWSSSANASSNLYHCLFSS